MTDIVNNATIRVVADASGVEAGLRPAVDAAQRAGAAITQSGERAAGAARAVESAQRNIIASIQRTTMAMEAGGRTTAAYYEASARQKNVDPAALTPYLNQLRAVEAAQAKATESTRAHPIAARDLAQAQTSKDSFLAGLREQIALFGKSADEVLRYRAAQAGASQESAMLILQLNNMRAAHDQVASATRAQATAEREAAQAQANKESFLSGLREQVALFGKSADEVLRYRAAQAGASQEAGQLIAQLHSMRLAQEQVEAAARATAAAQRDAAQTQANKESFLASLREQVTLFGKSADEVLRFRAAQAGAAQESAQLILQLQNMRAAQEQVEVAARAAAAAQREVAQLQANKDSFLAGLREQVTLFGKSADEVLRYRAAQAGATQESAQLILQLQNMRAAQEQVTTAARAAATAQREAAQTDASKATFIQGLREQIALFGLSTDEVLRYRAAQVGAASAADPLIAKLRDLRLAQEQATYGERMFAQAQREAAQARTGQDSFVKSLEQQAAAIGKTRLELIEMQAAQLGVTTRAKPFIDQLRASEQGLQNGGMSAAAMNAALRNVPAQMTDIIVSLQGGQAPLTVLLQQGGQLRDMFGSVGGAAKALGGAVLGLINPYTVAIATLALGAAALKAGHEESIRYSRALALTGNITGTTSLQMADMANNIGAVSGSQRDAAAALTLLASIGSIAVGDLERFGTVAVDAQHVLKKSIEDTAKEFADLGKSPLSALQSINEKYHFITAATYEQVKAAQEQGRTIEAASISQRAYADGITGQRQKVLDSLTDWERGWLRIKKGISGAIDAAIDFAGGREVGPQERINALLAQREATQARVNRLQEVGKRRDGDKYDPSKDRDLAGAQSALQLNQREIDAIRDKGKAAKDAAAAEAATVRADELRIKWLDEKNVLLTRQQLLARDLSAAETAGRENGLGDAEIQERLSVVRRKYNDVYVDGIDRSITALRKRGELEGLISQRALAQIEAQRNAGSISEDEALRQTAAEQVAQLNRQESSMRAQLGMVRSKIGSQREQLDLEGQIAMLGAQRTSRAMQLENDLAAAQRARAKESSDLHLKGIETASAELGTIRTQVDAQRMANSEIGLSKAALADLQFERLNDTAALKDQTAAMLDAIEPGSALAERYRRQAEELRNLAAAKREGAVKLDAAESSKKALDELNQFLDPGRAETFGEALREAFGGAGDAISKTTASLDGFARRQEQIAKARATAEAQRGTKDFDEIKYQKTVLELNERDTKNRLSGYGAMAGAAAGFFDEQSKGYQALQAVSQVFHAAELAMTLAELVPKGISAVLSQGTGDPYSAFGRMAAMAAVVAGLGVAIGGVSGSSSVPVSESRQKKQGTGSVLGSDAKSESIARALDGIEGATVQGLAISNGMLASLRNIEVGIGQFSSLLVRTTGVTGKFGADMGKNVFDTKAIGLGGAVLGGVGGAMGGAYLGMGASQIGLMLGGPVGMALGAALGAVIGKTFIGKALGSVFGGKQTVEDTGFTLDKASFASILAGGTNASQYADIKKDGGWFGSDKKSTKMEGIGADGNRQIASILTSLYDTVFEAGKMLGIGADGFEAQLNSFVVDIGKVSLKGLSDDEIEKELSAVFSKVGDNLASFGVAGLESFQKVGEGYLETLTRVATNYQAVSAVTDSMGMTFSSVGLASVGARERLIDLVGGLDEFTSSADQFLADFYTDKERADSLRARITPTLDQYGIKTGAEDSLKQFRSVVTGLDLTTDAGARAYAALMQIAPAFKQIADVDANTLSGKRDLEIQIMELLGDKTGAVVAARAVELRELDASLRPLQERVYALEDEATAIEAANARRSLEAQILGLTGNKAGELAITRAIELAGMDAALRPLKERIFGLQDEATALQVSNARRSLEAQILGLTGDKAGELVITRALELAGIDSSLRPLKERVYALQDEASSLQTANSLLGIQAQIYELTGDKSGAAAVLAMQHVNALAALDPALHGATQNLWDLQAAAKATEQVKTAAAALMSGVDGAFSALQKVVERQKKATQEEIDVRTKAVEKTRSLSETLRSTLDGLTVAGTEKNDRAAAQAQIQAALAIAKASGILPKADDLKNALSVIGKDSTGLFASQEDYLRDFYATKNGITDLATITDKTLSAEERSLKALEGQVKQYDQMLEREQEQIDVLKGISTIGLSIEQAIQALRGAMGAAGANPYNSATSQISDAYKSNLGRAPDAAGLSYWQDRAAGGISTEAIIGSIKGSPEAQIQALYKDVFGRPADAAGLSYWIDRLKGGISLSSIRATFEETDEKKLRGFAVGTNYVPADMPAKIHEGERIIPAADNRELMRRLASPGENSAVLVSAVERLTEENRGMRKDLNDALYAIAKNTMNTASSLDDAINGDKPLATKVIPA